MRSTLLNPRHPLWARMGWALFLVVGVVTTVFFLKRPDSIRAGEGKVPFEGLGMGRYGEIVERLERSTFTLNYDTIRGSAEAQHLEGIKGRVEESDIHWMLTSPRAERLKHAWTLEGPLEVVAKEVASGKILGEGAMQGEKPVLQWVNGVWKGLVPLVWEDHEGQGQGTWVLPAGWTRGMEGRVEVKEGPVTWRAREAGPLLGLKAQRMSVLLGKDDAQLELVESDLVGGRVDAGHAALNKDSLRLTEHVKFRREDGWHGEAETGWAPRPVPGQSFQRMEFSQFQAFRAIPGGEERLSAGGARWIPEGLRMEGNVQWRIPYEGAQLLLRAPRLCFRTGPGGEDLPSELNPGEGWAEGLAVLSWGPNSLSSPRMEARQADRSWKLLAPVEGRGEAGTFQAGQGAGKPGQWVFQGPVQARLHRGGTVRGDQLAWTEGTWTFTGRPAQFEGLTEQVRGTKVVRRGDEVIFPEGLSGVLQSPEDTLAIEAQKGLRKGVTMELGGKVSCRGAGWALTADQMQVTLGAGRRVTRVEAQGSLRLTGNLGSGQGRKLVLDLVERKLTWEGRVRGTAEVQQ